jgi:Cu2+-exporting ATPase
MLLFFLLVGRALDHAMRRKTRAVAGNLAALKADTAHRFMGDELVSVPAAALHAGDRLLVKAGERVPADGSVLSGVSELDESLTTGETARRKVGAGAAIYAGSMNYSGALTLRVTAADRATLLDEIERLLEKAASAKSRTMRLADRTARFYAPAVHLTAALTFVGWWLAGASLHDAVVTAIAVLIITCPCALALAIPAVQVVASGALFRCGVILNAGDAIERLGEADTVIFDKTGTLTLPEPRVIDAAAIEPELLQIAARLALSSRHPLAVALAREVASPIPYDRATEEPGQGVRAMIDGVEARLGSAEFCSVAQAATYEPGASHIYFVYGSRAATIAISQKLRPDAVEVVRVLAGLRLDLHILSGDRDDAVEPIARTLGIDNWQGGLKPAEKIIFIEALKAHGRRVLMIGDGLNDAPALASAHVSLSPIGAADVTQAQADAVFLGERLKPVLDAVLVGRRARALMKENLLFAVIYNIVAVPVAIAGAVTPLIAALAMSGSSIMVTLNALRANRRGKQP